MYDSKYLDNFKSNSLWPYGKSLLGDTIVILILMFCELKYSGFKVVKTATTAF